jgi:hypothetical protein
MPQQRYGKPRDTCRMLGAKRRWLVRVGFFQNGQRN